MDDYSTEGYYPPIGDKRNGSSHTYGYGKSDVYDWLSDIVMPPDYKVCNIIEIEFKGSRKEFYLNDKNIHFKNGELSVVEGSVGGHDVGHVSLSGELIRMQLKKKNVQMEEVVKKIYRRATPADVSKWNQAKEMEVDTLHKARYLAKELGLSMKLSDVDYQGDKSKATFYYTAESRIDFRELIKHLSETFLIRIEMRQIGMREEASRIGGMGPCGSYLCCHTWTTNFKTGSSLELRRKKNPPHKTRDNKFGCYIKDERENTEIIKSDNLKNKAQKNNKSVVARALSNENVFGHDNIIRFDAKGGKRKNKNRKNKKRKSE